MENWTGKEAIGFDMEEKMKKRWAVILITVFLLVVSVIPGTAKSESTTVTGTCTIIGSSMEEGWGIDLPADPDFRIWWNENGIIHWRNALWLFECDYDDDRLDGYMLVSDNWNVFANPNRRPRKLFLKTIGR